MAKIPVSSLLNDFQRMYQERWDYVAGGSSERQVDCSGAFVWAFRQHGCRIYHGSNRIARAETVELIPIQDAQIVPGMAAFKSRAPGLLNGYSLPESYRFNGSYYNGDVNDYYHIGLVAEDTSQVLNAQSAKTGFVSSDLRKSGWAYVAYLKQVDYGASQAEGRPSEGVQGGDRKAPLSTSDATNPTEESQSEGVQGGDRKAPLSTSDATNPTEGGPSEGVQGGDRKAPLSSPAREPDILRTATVCAPRGETVKLRQKPSKSCGLYWDVPVGAEVLVRGTEQSGWTPVTWGGHTGYMMSVFLAEGQPPASAGEANWAAEVYDLTREQAEALRRLYPSANVFETHG